MKRSYEIAIISGKNGLVDYGNSSLCLNPPVHQTVDSENCGEEIKKKLSRKSTIATANYLSNKKLSFNFFDQPCIDLAKELLGKKLVRKLDTGELLSGYIVETEAYLGVDDKAAHSYGGKETDRNKAMFMPAGTAYVYNIYGMYTCFNISSQGYGSAVLIRAVDPVNCTEIMKLHRETYRKRMTQLKETDLCNGPSKLTQAFKINKVNTDQKDLTTCNHLWLEEGLDVAENEIIKTKRIGIAYAEEWTDKLLRFYLLGNRSVSKRDKVAESQYLASNNT